MYETIFKFRFVYETFLKSMKPSLVQCGTFFQCSQSIDLKVVTVGLENVLHTIGHKYIMIAKKTMFDVLTHKNICFCCCSPNSHLFFDFYECKSNIFLLYIHLFRSLISESHWFFFYRASESVI